MRLCLRGLKIKKSAVIHTKLTAYSSTDFARIGPGLSALEISAGSAESRVLQYDSMTPWNGG